jgi:hypothetical protein
LIKDAQKMLRKPVGKIDNKELAKKVEPLLKNKEQLKTFIEKYTRAEKLEKLEKYRINLESTERSQDKNKEIIKQYRCLTKK